MQAAHTPDAVALVGDRTSLTYRQLNEQANQLAHALRALGVGPEIAVAVLLERSPNVIVAILAVLKAGGAYVPIDPVYPAERIAFMLVDAAVAVVIAERALGDRVVDSNIPIIWLDHAVSALADQPTCAPKVNVSTHHAAYIIYTSGSTGRPKGVIVSHANVTRLFDSTERWFGSSPADVWALFHSYAFDVSVWEMWGALLHGGRLVVVSHEVSRSPHALYRLLCRQAVTVLCQTPSAFQQLIQAEDDLGVDPTLALRTIILAGEALILDHLRPWYARHEDHAPQLVNMYGPTETTVYATYQPLTNTMVETETGSPIGVPIPDMQVVVLDQNHQLVPIGVPGVLYVGGEGVARGYLNRPELTSERFVDNPFQPGTRLYNSGDRVRWRANGTLDYLGRLDHQVKIRGYRVELGEVEASLRQHMAVADCVVVADASASGDKRLVAYWVAHASISIGVPDLLAHMRKLLPDYMIPAIFIRLDALPLTPNGKVDRRALPDADGSRPDLHDAYVAPRSSWETMLAEIWCNVLGLKQVGVFDNFFDLGGHSLLATQVVSRIRSVFQVEMPLRTFFERPTVDGLAGAVATLVAIKPTSAWVDSRQNAPSDLGLEIEEFVL
jgi:amino acid adenylation domain-containing protein